MRTDMFFAVEALQPAPDPDVHVGLKRLRAVVAGFLRVNPFLDVDGARAVVEGVGNVGRLRVDLADLADDGELGERGAVDNGVLAGKGFRPVDQLLDGYGSEGFVAVRLGRDGLEEKYGRTERKKHYLAATTALTTLLL
jgi:hypothetical protein